MKAEPLFLRALRGEQGDSVPVWFMRQAGRYLPEYRELRAKHKTLEMMQTPEIAAEITLQPLRRFPLSAGIIYADILTPLIGMGMELSFVEGEGPRIGNPLRNEKDILALRNPPAEESVPYTLAAITAVVKELQGKDVPLIGFSGAPFTLSLYMMGGREGDAASLKQFMVSEPHLWKVLQEKLVEMVAEYLVAQVKAGAQAVQIFDSWIGTVGPHEFCSYVLPYLTAIVSRVRSKVSAPIIYFGTGTAGLLPYYSQIGADAYGVDWRISFKSAAGLIGGSPVLQGNLDPALLFAPPAYLREAVTRILEEGRSLRGHIFNVGHGVTPKTPIESVQAVVQLVRDFKR